MNQNHGLSGHKLSFPHKIRAFSVYEISNWISRKLYRNFSQVHRCFLAVTWPPFFVPLLDGIRTTDSVSRGKFFVPCAKGSEKKVVMFLGFLHGLGWQQQKLIFLTHWRQFRLCYEAKKNFDPPPRHRYAVHWGGQERRGVYSAPDIGSRR